MYTSYTFVLVYTHVTYLSNL